MRRAFVGIGLLFVVLFAMMNDARAQEPPCRFVLGFADLRAAIGAATMGECLEDEQHTEANGDATQRTTRGLAVWRKASNTMAFTDGSTSWVVGPNGVQRRPNTHRFRWEPDGPMLSGGMGADPNAPVEMTPEIVRVTNANRRAAGLPPLDIGVQPAPPPPGSGDAAVAAAATAAARALASTPPTATPQPTAPAPTATPGTAVTMTRDPSAGVAPASLMACPSTHPVKGNQGSRDDDEWIYHEPGSRSYAATQPERCFANPSEAAAAGYRAPDR